MLFNPTPRSTTFLLPDGGWTIAIDTAGATGDIVEPWSTRVLT